MNTGCLYFYIVITNFELDGSTLALCTFVHVLNDSSTHLTLQSLCASAITFVDFELHSVQTFIIVEQTLESSASKVVAIDGNQMIFEFLVDKL